MHLFSTFIFKLTLIKQLLFYFILLQCIIALLDSRGVHKELKYPYVHSRGININQFVLVKQEKYTKMFQN